LSKAIFDALFMKYRMLLGLKAYILRASKLFTKVVILCEISNVTVKFREFKTVKGLFHAKKILEIGLGKGKKGKFSMKAGVAWRAMAPRILLFAISLGCSIQLSFTSR
jgi:hypothetical protein